MLALVPVFASQRKTIQPLEFAGLKKHSILNSLTILWIKTLNDLIKPCHPLVSGKFKFSIQLNVFLFKLV